jgi:hypothetical protein
MSDPQHEEQQKTEEQQPEDPIAKRRRELAERNTALEKRRETRTVLYELDVQERDLRDKERLAAIEDAKDAPVAKWGAVVHTTSPPPLPGLVVLSRPATPEWKAWVAIAQKQAANQRDKDQGMHDLARSMVLYPERAVYEQMLAVVPGLHVAITAEASRMAGVISEEKGKE